MAIFGHASASYWHRAGARIVPEQYGNGREDSTKNGEPATVKFGMQIQNLTEQQADRLGIDRKSVV